MREFFVTAPLDAVRYITIEIYHPDDGVSRYVADQQFAKQLKLEDDAPRNSGEVVEFEAAAIDVPLPEQGEDGEIELEAQLGAVGTELATRLKKIDLWEPIEIIRREWRSDEDEPHSVLRMHVNEIGVDGQVAGFTAGQVNQSAHGIAQLYKTDEFPGLEVQL